MCTPVRQAVRQSVRSLEHMEHIHHSTQSGGQPSNQAVLFSLLYDSGAGASLDSKLLVNGTLDGLPGNASLQRNSVIGASLKAWW